MKTLTHSSPIQIAASIPKLVKMNMYILKPLKAGFVGFAIILITLFVINLFSYISGSTEKFGMDYLDLLLAAVGFVLQMVGTLLESFIR